MRYLERALAIAESTFETADPTLLQLVESQTIVLEHLGRRAEAEHTRERVKLLRDARTRTETIN